jgi:hypothetical protein
MDERLHEHTMSSNATCPSKGPTTIFKMATPGCVEKPYSTPRYDEYPKGDTSHPTTNGTVSKPWKSNRSQYPPN